LAWLAVLIADREASAAGRRPYGGAIDIPVRDFSGLVDPHLVETRSGRLVASLVHLHLFRMRDDAPVPELAADLGTYVSDRLILSLAPARFHDGTPVTAADVVASLRRIARLGDASPVGRLVAALEVSERDPATVVIAAPRGSHPDELRLLLARPEVAICRGGAPQLGGGPFRLGRDGGDIRVLVAWEGHPEGRPFLQEVRLLSTPVDRESVAFADGRLGLTSEPLVGPAPDRMLRARGGLATWFLVFHPRFRADPIRGLSRALILGARVPRFIEGRAMAGELPFPEALSPVPRLELAATPTIRPSLVLAYPPNEPGAAELGRAVRDALRPLSPDARVVPAPGLSLEAARRDASPSWDMAIVRRDWAALSKSQAAHELARAFALEGPSPADVLARRVTEWGRGVVERQAVIAVAHLELPILARSPLEGLGRAGPLPELGGAYRGRR
jgi:hypothetical protein